MDKRIAFERSSGTLALGSPVFSSTFADDTFGNSIVARAPVQTRRTRCAVDIRWDDWRIDSFQCDVNGHHRQGVGRGIWLTIVPAYHGKRWGCLHIVIALSNLLLFVCAHVNANASDLQLFSWEIRKEQKHINYTTNNALLACATVSLFLWQLSPFVPDEKPWATLY